MSSISRFVRWGSRSVGVAAVLTPCAGHAHIKWFCAYDTTVPPLPLHEVVTPAFVAVSVGFSALIFIALVADRWLARTSAARRLEDIITRGHAYVTTLIRIAAAILFVILWQDGTTILTPELKTTNGIVPWVQLAVAVCMLSRTTLILGAAGIMGLYAYGVAEYGAFHMMDYPIIPGIAAYLALTTIGGPLLLSLRLPILYASVAITMAWGAIEKFGYPYWTFPLLADHPGVTFGLGYQEFMYVAGFVEFSLAFFMLAGTALLRWACLFLLLLLTGAIPAFGKVDAVGHELIIASLIVMVIAGHRVLRLPAVIEGSPPLTRAGLLTAAYSASFVGLSLMYYASQAGAGR